MSRLRGQEGLTHGDGARGSRQGGPHDGVGGPTQGDRGPGASESPPTFFSYQDISAFSGLLSSM